MMLKLFHSVCHFQTVVTGKSEFESFNQSINALCHSHKLCGNLVSDLMGWNLLIKLSGILLHLINQVILLFRLGKNFFTMIHQSENFLLKRFSNESVWYYCITGQKETALFVCLVFLFVMTFLESNFKQVILLIKLLIEY